MVTAVAATRTRGTDNVEPFDLAWLRKDFGTLIAPLDLTDAQLHYLRSRWLESLLWMESSAQKTRRFYYALRLVTVIGAVIVPALVSINAVGGAKSVVTWLTFAVSLVVAISAAVEGFFRFGERWRHYRRTVEELKTEGWALSELGGAYGKASTHGAAFPLFVTRVEELLRQETATYIADIATPAKSSFESEDT
jgi:hypothetical protein